MRKQDTGDLVISRPDLRDVLVPVVLTRYHALVAVAAGAGLRWRSARSLGTARVARRSTTCGNSYATWLVDHGVPPTMAMRVMGHEKVTTLELYARRTDRILRALVDEHDLDNGAPDGVRWFC